MRWLVLVVGEVVRFWVARVSVVVGEVVSFLGGAGVCGDG